MCLHVLIYYCCDSSNGKEMLRVNHWLAVLRPLVKCMSTMTDKGNLGRGNCQTSKYMRRVIIYFDMYLKQVWRQERDKRQESDKIIERQKILKTNQGIC